MLRFSIKFLLLLVLIFVFLLCLMRYEKTLPKEGRKIFPQKEIGAFEVDNLLFEKKKSGSWHITNFDGYYADIGFIKNILYIFENAKYDGIKKEEYNFEHEFVLFGKEYQTTGKIIKIKKKTWNMSVGMNLYSDKFGYAMKPLDKINYQDVESCKVDGIDSFYIEEKLINQLNAMKFCDVKKKELESPIKTIEITLSSGLVIVVEYYHDDWVVFKYLNPSLIKTSALRDLENKKMITEGWAFKLVCAK